MDALEKFMLENRDAFDDAEPSAGHFIRFERKLGALGSTSATLWNRSVMLRIAASLLILVSVALVFAYVTKDRLFRASGQESSLAGLPVEVREAILYYDGRVQDRILKIQGLEKSCPGAQNLTAMAETQLQTLDADSHELRQTLSRNPKNEKVLAALIQNEQMKEKILDNMIQKGCPGNRQP